MIEAKVIGKLKDSDHLTVEELKTITDQESKNYIDSTLGEEESKFRSDYLEEQLSLQFLVEEGNCDFSDSDDYGDQIAKLVEQGNEEQKTDFKHIKIMKKGGKHGSI